MNMENQKHLTSHQSQDAKTYPFICGICSLQFDNLSLFLHHFRTHSRAYLSKNNIHICSCLYQDTENVEEGEINEPYKCRSCMKQFFSICKVHSHMVRCSMSNGSYILDNSKKMVYPISLHCSTFETRENDKCETVNEDHVKINKDTVNHREVSVSRTERHISGSEKNLNHTVKDLPKDLLGNGSNSYSKMSYTQQVDHILKCVCKLFENGEAEEIQKVESMDSKKEEKKSSLKKQVNSHFISDKTKTEKVKKRRNKSNSKKIKVIEEEESEGNKLEVVKDKVAVKIEHEENNFCDENSLKNNFDISHNVSTGAIARNNDFDDVNVESNSDDADENDYLTDEYTLEDIDVENKLQEENRSKEMKNSLKHTKIKNEVNHQKVKDRNVKLRKITENIFQKKRGCRQKATVPAVECPHCGKFLKPYRMKVHLVSHMEERPFQCDVCPKSYKYHGHLESHKASHKDVKPFYCEICGKGFIAHTVLKQHFLMHHSDSKPCVCHICGASFITNYRLKRHMTKHTGEKSVQCDLCGMGFSTRYNLSIHIQGVHKRDHRFTCAQCGKNFMTNYQLKVHNMKHSGERPYKCAVCKAEYIERKELRRHLKKQHNQSLEENTNALTELMDGYDISKMMSTKDMPQLSQVSGESHGQIMDQTETSSAADFITTGNENMYSYTTTDMCPPSPYYTTTKKLLPPNEYQMIYGNTQEYNYDNSTVELTLPLTVQEMHDSTKYHSTNHETDAVKVLSNSDEKVSLNESM